MNHGALRKQYEIKHLLRSNLIFKNRTKQQNTETALNPRILDHSIYEQKQSLHFQDSSD